jgi:hypothetical protein
LYAAGHYGYYWSATSSGNQAYVFEIGRYVSYDPSCDLELPGGHPVRCFKEGTGSKYGSYDSDFSIESATDLSLEGTANSYIVSESGTYCFNAVKGNSSASLESVASAEVLWESFGTTIPPYKGDLIVGARYSDGKVYFKTADSYQEGNALIVIRDDSGTILWSWHIWLTDLPVEQVYYNNAGTMMDRNLGAISATPGDVGALGLFYQWGRKDPFLGLASTTSTIFANSTYNWPSNVEVSSIDSPVEYSIANPTTFISSWDYDGSLNGEEALWHSEKTVYDPCPAGWRVPNGGVDGIWASASGNTFTGVTKIPFYDSENSGANFSDYFGPDQIIWYPANGQRSLGDAQIRYHNTGHYWSVTPDDDRSLILYFDVNHMGMSYSGYGEHGNADSFRCFKEDTGGGA